MNKNIGLIGYGYWGPNLLRNFAKTEGCLVKYCCDKEQSRLNEVNKIYPSIVTTTNANDLFEDDELDAIIVATPTETHYDLASRAIKSGKDVLIEKPMTTTLKEAKSLSRLSKKHKKIVMVDHIFMFNPAVRKVKELVDGGTLGEIMYIDSIRANLGVFQEKVNAIYDLATHDFSIIQYLFDKKPKAVRAFGTSHYHKHNKQEDVCYVTVEYTKNVFAHVHVSWLSPLKIRNTIIVGTKKMVVYDEVDPAAKVRIYDKGVELKKPKDIRERQISYRSGDIWIPNISTEEALSVLAREFVEAINTRKQPLSNVDFGAIVLKLLEKSNEALRSEGKIRI